MRFSIRFLRRARAFTLIELLTVMAIIAVLAGLILSISGYANKKAALSRATGEIQALSAACERFKSDNGTYPHQQLAAAGVLQTGGTAPSDLIDPRVQGNSNPSNSIYTNASLELYEALSGDLSCSGSGGGVGVPNYIADLKPDTLGRANPSLPVSNGNQVLYLQDPFGNSYGYSTANATAVALGTAVTLPGFNPTFDLWSTGGQTGTPASTPGSTGDPAMQWVKNW